MKSPKLTQTLPVAARRSKALAAMSGSNAPEPKHTCYLCGHQWQSVDRDTAKKVRAAAKINRQGPYCFLCFHLEFAARYAEARGYKMLRDAVEDWMENGANHLNDKV